ncbi:MAG: hydrogenase/urease maturation nickel metallochaperone HypA [Candidatus Nanohalobium sp.]
MHDVKVAERVSEEVRKRLEEEDKSRIENLEVSVGGLLLLNPEQLGFWIKEALEDVADTESIEVKISRPVISCNCGFKGEISLEKEGMHQLTASMLECPECGERNPEIKEGRRCFIEKLSLK